MRPGDRSHDRPGQGRAPRRVPKSESNTLAACTHVFPSQTVPSDLLPHPPQPHLTPSLPFRRRGCLFRFSVIPLAISRATMWRPSSRSQRDRVRLIRESDPRGDARRIGRSIAILVAVSNRRLRLSRENSGGRIALCASRTPTHRTKRELRNNIVDRADRESRGRWLLFPRDAGQTKRSRFLRLVLAPRSRYRAPYCGTVTTLAALSGYDKIINRPQCITFNYQCDRSRETRCRKRELSSSGSRRFAKCIREILSTSSKSVSRIVATFVPVNAIRRPARR